MAANDRQVGGKHYQKPYQHWDWVPRIGMDYFLAAATKYLDRYREKNGVADVEKAVHYVEKFIEVSAMYAPTRMTANFDWIETETERFLSYRTERPSKELSIFRLLATWTSVRQLEQAKLMLEDIVSELRTQEQTDREVRELRGVLQATG